MGAGSECGGNECELMVREEAIREGDLGYVQCYLVNAASGVRFGLSSLYIPHSGMVRVTMCIYC